MKIQPRFFSLCLLALSASALVPAQKSSRAQARIAQGRLQVETSYDNGLSIPPRKRRVQVPTVKVPSNQDIMKQASEGYSRLTKEHYLVMAFLQAGCLASCADMTTQAMAGHGIDFGHVAAMASVASTMSGAINAVWLRQLEQAFPGTGTKQVVAKTMIHAVILASIINSAYLVGVPFLTDYVYGTLPLDPSAIFQGWSLDEFITLTKLEVMMFIPYNTLAFKYVPPSVRPLTHATISATFNVAVSAVTLGYFDTWCEHAMHVVGH